MVEISNLAMVTAAVLYVAAVLAHVWEWALGRGVTEPNKKLRLRIASAGRVGVAITVVALLSQTVGIVARGIVANRVPVANMYEFVTMAVAFLVAAYLVCVWRLGWRWLGLGITMLAAWAIGLAVTVFYVQVAPLMPALHSVWFVIHIVAACVAAAAFNVGGVAAVMYLIRARAEKQDKLHGYVTKLPPAEKIDRFSYVANAVAFPIWTFVIVAGAIWAQYAWGRFWGWDPKETWSLVTWVIYGAYLHARMTAGVSRKVVAIIALVGLFSFWFNFIGVNLLFPGLHAYSGR